MLLIPFRYLTFVRVNCAVIHNLPSKIIWQSYDIIFIGWIMGVGMLPYFCNDAPRMESY
jgi:hypothetical protein